MAIEKVGVIGAGVMGAGIAAHVTNAGIPVVLLDIVPEGADNRNAVAERAVERLLKTEPSAFMHPGNAKLISAGNVEDDLARLGGCDWIVEAVIERLDVKRALYQKLASVAKPDAIFSSNTSTIPLAQLVGQLPEAFRRRFLITHFFNPPRYMRLLEIVAGADTEPQVLEQIRNFCDIQLGKGVVACKDTPGFIGNRIGVYWIQYAVVAAMRAGLTVEEADAVMGKPIGAPKTGVFGLSDLVGIDLLPHVLASLEANLPAEDPFHDVSAVPDLIEAMIAEGFTGRKGKGGFYRLRRDGAERVKEAKDLSSGDYREARKPGLECLAAAKEGGLRALVEHSDRGGQYAWDVLSHTLSYAASLVPTIADDIVAVDEAMRLGFNWERGPFELLDELGPAWFRRQLETEERPVPALLAAAGEETFYRVEAGKLEYLAVGGGYRCVSRAPGVLLLGDIKRSSDPLAGNGSASLWDIGDGVACLEFHTKMNAIDQGTFEMIRTALALVPQKGLKALVLHNEAPNFSVGANLALAMYAVNIAAWSDLEDLVRAGQAAYQALKTAPFPVVGAPTGLALGGGCEVLLHCDALQAHAESYLGLVEVGVGLIPGWGGCTAMLERWAQSPAGPRGPMPPIMKSFETISTAQVSKSAVDAKRLGFLRPDDGVSMNRDRLLADAKRRALGMAEHYRPPEPFEVSLPGPSAKVALEMAVHGYQLIGKASDYDGVIAGHLADVLSGGACDITEPVETDTLHDLERKAFMALLHEPRTLARIEHMLSSGKPLRN